MSKILIIRQLGLQPYEVVLLAMRRFTEARSNTSDDEVWLVQHPPIFTHGSSTTSINKHLLYSCAIPVVKSDRGGKITFHGPGQQLMYVLLDLHRRKLSVRDLITLLEQIVVATLSHFSIIAHSEINAPGVYVGSKKICSIGLRINKGCSFHGLALNVAMDLSPFLYINPCGYDDLSMTQVSDLAPGINIDDITPILLTKFLKLMKFSY